jgi:hypothetical protein
MNLRDFKDKGRSPKVEAEHRAKLYEMRWEKYKAANPDHNWNGSNGPWQYHSREEFIKDQIKRVKHNRNLRKRWPAGKQKMQVVLEHIQNHPDGLTYEEIRQFVWEKNGYKGKCPRYYWMSILRNPDDIDHGKDLIGLLPGWCNQDPITKRWILQEGVELKPPFLKLNMANKITAGDYRRILGRDPRLDGIRIHNAWNSKKDCACYIPDDFIIRKDSIKEEYWEMLGFKTNKQRLEFYRKLSAIPLDM